MEEQEEAKVLAEKVMGWRQRLCESGKWLNKICFYEPMSYPPKCIMPIKDWHPHTNIEQAMMVEEQLRGQGWAMLLCYHISTNDWQCSFLKHPNHEVMVFEATPAAAICAAAIKTAGKEE